MGDIELKTALHDELRWAREAMLWKLEGLSEYDVRRPLTATGTNLLGLKRPAGTAATSGSRRRSGICSKSWRSRPGGWSATSSCCERCGDRLRAPDELPPGLHRGAEAQARA